MSTDRVLSGMGPTGRLHLGHYHGVLKNWCELQNQHDCYFMIADLAALTTHYEKRDVIKNNIWEMLVDWLAAGIEPEKATIFIQSRVPEHNELAWLLGMNTPLEWLQNIPAYQEKISKLQGTDLSTYGFLGDPVMQAADILIYRANLVPVGADQIDHLKLSSMISARFNQLYGDTKKGMSAIILPQPKPKLTDQPSLPGLDGDKMSKSYGNAIFLRSTAETIEEKVLGMTVAKSSAKDPGDPNICPVYKFHEVYSSKLACSDIYSECLSGKLNCNDCKKPLIKAIVQEQIPMFDRAELFLSSPEYLVDVVNEGCLKARSAAKETLLEVRDAMGLNYDQPVFTS